MDFYAHYALTQKNLQESSPMFDGGLVGPDFLRRWKSVIKDHDYLEGCIEHQAQDKAFDSLEWVKEIKSEMHGTRYDSIMPLFMVNGWAVDISFDAYVRERLGDESFIDKVYESYQKPEVREIVAGSERFKLFQAIPDVDYFRKNKDVESCADSFISLYSRISEATRVIPARSPIILREYLATVYEKMNERLNGPDGAKNWAELDSSFEMIKYKN